MANRRGARQRILQAEIREQQEWLRGRGPVHFHNSNSNRRSVQNGFGALEPSNCPDISNFDIGEWEPQSQPDPIPDSAPPMNFDVGVFDPRTDVAQQDNAVVPKVIFLLFDPGLNSEKFILPKVTQYPSGSVLDQNGQSCQAG